MGVAQVSRALEWLKRELEVAKRRRQLALEELVAHDQKREQLRNQTTVFDADILEFENEIKQQEQING
jgi:predicted  nucleic acid-binding Zn-ribbon protein